VTVADPDASSANVMPDEPAERVRSVIERVLESIDISADVVIEEDEERITARIEGEEDLGLLIGRHGQTIDALQLLCYRAAFRGLDERKRVVVDAAGYRERRYDVLSRQADSAAERALQGGNPVQLEPMTAQERRVVHDHLKERSGVETYSEGDEPDRRVIVAPLVSG
jgi:spoIIIJ-associated protein